MKIKLSKPNEWGYFINPETLEIQELAGEIQNDSLVIIYKREYRSDLSRSLIRILYAQVSKNMLVYQSKKDLSKRLAKLCSKYMIEKNTMPPKVTIAKEMKEDKPVELVYSFRKNEIFQFQVTNELLNGKNPKEYIERLIDVSDKDFYKIKEEKRWKVEYAPNGRALCKKCKRQIKSKEIRFGELQVVEDLMSQQFYHLKCIDWNKLKKDNVYGIDDLKEEDIKRISKKIN